MNFNMRNIRFGKYIVGVSLAMGVMGMQSCKKYLDVKAVSSFDADYVFDNVPNATKAVLGAYASMTGDQAYGIRLNMYYAYDNDEMMGQAATPYPDNERRDIAHYSATASNTQLSGPFNQLYAGVERANICIYYIPKMEMYTGGDSTTKKQLRSLYGEALTLRAQFFFELVRNWGDVPAQFDPSFAQKDLYLGKTDRDVIYEHLLDDLKTAEGLVPWRSESGMNTERITQGAVRALRARIALFRAGWSCRSNGAMQKGSNPNTYYQIAKDECFEIIQRPQDHKLNPSYKSVWKDYICSNTIEPNGEVLWEVAFGGTSGSTDSKLGYYNGPKFNGTGNSALTILPNYFYLFDSSDTRRDVVCAPYDINSDMTLTARGAHKLVDGKFRRDWGPSSTLTSTGQYFGVNWPLIRYSDVLLMYAEAVNELNGGPDAGAKIALEQVRTRGFGGNAALIGITPSDYTGFFNAIVKERSLELGGEGIRKYDLIRWNLLAAKLKEAHDIMDAMSTGTPPWSYANFPTKMYYKTSSSTATGVQWYNSFYQTEPGSAPAGYSSIGWLAGAINSSILTYYAVGFLGSGSPAYKSLLPLPQSALDANPNLKQNFGY